MSTISVIVPVYNAEKTLRKCISSILKQTYRDFELILVNDGSNDMSLDICTEFKENDNRIKIIDQINKGSHIARKTGIENATGFFVTFVDSDDWIEPCALSKLHEIAIKYKADVVVCNSKKVFGPMFDFKLTGKRVLGRKEEYYSKKRFMSELYISFFGITNFPVSMWGKLYRRDRLREIYVDEKKRFYGEDLIFNIQVMPEMEGVVVIPDELYNYRAGGGTHKYQPLFFEELTELHKIKKRHIQKYNLGEVFEYYLIIELINTYKAFIVMELVAGKLKKEELIKRLDCTLKNEEIINAINHPKISRYRDQDFINAIKGHNVQELIRTAKKGILKKKAKRFFIGVLTKMANF